MKTANVQKITRDILAGRWIFDGVPITFDDDGVMRSGQHRCLAVIQAGEQNPDVSVQVMVVEGVSPDSTLTANSGAPTSGGDVLHMAGYVDSIGLSALVRLHHSWVSGEIVTVSSYVNTKFKMSAQEILDHLNANPGLVEANKIGWQIQRGTVGYPKSAVALFVHEARKIDAAQASVFVGLVADRVRQGTGDPLVALDAKGSAHIRSQYGSRKSMSPALAMYCFSRVWNAWRTGERISSILIRSDQSKIPPMK